MLGRVGIGIVTYNRKDLVRETVRSVRRFTRRDDVDLVVADDGSTDGTGAMLREDDVPVVTGVNMGVAWNKNRALYLLAQVRRCEAVILLEDDAMPDRIGWESGWIDAAMRWGHVNYAADWLKSHFASGEGTADAPFMSTIVTAQCAAYSRDALDWAGYFDSRFRGYGHEHVEHTRRLIRTGAGGTEHTVDGAEQVLFALIRGDVAVHPSVTTGNDADVARNLEVARHAMGDHSYRAPWRNIPELRQFRAEITSATEARPFGFALRGQGAPPSMPRRPGLFARLIRARA